MEQYIEREKFLKKSAECFGHFGVLVKAIEEIADECTTVDVVPKSEIESIKKETFEKIFNEIKLYLALDKKAFEDFKKDIYQEVFEE